MYPARHAGHFGTRAIAITGIAHSANEMMRWVRLDARWVDALGAGALARGAAGLLCKQQARVVVSFTEGRGR